MIWQTKVELDRNSGGHRARSLALIYERHTVRSYQPDVVEEATIRMLLDAAVHAPTAMHSEPWRFVVIQDRALLREISDRAKALAISSAASEGLWLKPPGEPGDGIRSMLADREFNIFYDASTLVAICVDMTNDFAVADSWLAAENLMLAAAGSGLGSCVIALAAEAMNTAEVKERLNISTHLTVVAPIIVGVPHGEPVPSPRKVPVVVSWLRG